MDKKTGRCVQPHSKGLTADKKNQDNHAKQWSKAGTRREPPLGTLSTKPDRKPIPQKSKTIDKRPKPRGRPDAVARDETSGLTDTDIELGSVFYPGSKKQSLNHLLNFTYASRNVNNSGRSGYVNKNGNNRALQTKKHKYNKEHFLQANCQFIVNSLGDYKRYMNDPDALVDWMYIEQINVQVNNEPSCPICLYPPVAAKMTRCGHIYCWCCILHYLSLSEKSWQKCPICYETIHKQDLKSVISISHNTFNVNEQITFKLMKRLKGSLLAYPADVEIDVKDCVRRVSETSDVHTKLLLAENFDILNIINRERHELNGNEIEDSERCFFDEAMVTLKEREDCILERFAGDIAVNELEPEVDIINEASADYRETKFYYFYQASDGQHIYMHAINARMLEHCYGSLENAPRTLMGKILEKEGGSMTEELRNRFKYLQHLPITCQFEMAEIELLPPLVYKSTMDYFRDQLEMRRRRRAKKAKEEKRREKRIAIEEDIKMGHYPAVNIPLESIDQFPAVGFEPSLLEDHESTSNISDEISSVSTSPPTIPSVSFAKMLSCNNTVNSWPGLRQKSSLSFSSATETPKNKSVNSVNKTIENLDNDSDHEVVPELNRSFGDVIAQALQQASEKDETGKNLKKGKKKKNKQKILLSTSMGYSGN